MYPGCNPVYPRCNPMRPGAHRHVRLCAHLRDGASCLPLPHATPTTHPHVHTHTDGDLSPSLTSLCTLSYLLTKGGLSATCRSSKYLGCIGITHAHAHAGCNPMRPGRAQALPLCRRRARQLRRRLLRLRLRRPPSAVHGAGHACRCHALQRDRPAAPLGPAPGSQEGPRGPKSWGPEGGEGGHGRARTRLRLCAWHRAPSCTCTCTCTCIPAQVTYESRLLKYAMRGFAIAVSHAPLDRRLQPYVCRLQP